MDRKLQSFMNKVQGSMDPNAYTFLLFSSQLPEIDNESLTGLFNDIPSYVEPFNGLSYRFNESSLLTAQLFWCCYEKPFRDQKIKDYLNQEFKNLFMS